MGWLWTRLAKSSLTDSTKLNEFLFLANPLNAFPASALVTGKHRSHKNTTTVIVGLFRCLGDTSVILLRMLNGILNGSLFHACINALRTFFHVCQVRLLCCGRRHGSAPNLFTFGRKWSTSMATPGSKCRVYLGFSETE